MLNNLFHGFKRLISSIFCIEHFGIELRTSTFLLLGDTIIESYNLYKLLARDGQYVYNVSAVNLNSSKTVNCFRMQRVMHCVVSSRILLNIRYQLSRPSLGDATKFQTTLMVESTMKFTADSPPIKENHICGHLTDIEKNQTI